MIFKEILNDQLFTLPIKQSSSNTYQSTIKQILSFYLNKLNSIPNGDLNIPGKNISGAFVKDVQNKFVSVILECINEHLNGYPSKAYNSLDIALKNDINDFTDIISFTHYTENNNNFYRIRLSGEDGKLFTKREMFHIPFSMRGKVASQRFSIPGFPSLYMSRSLYVCWEELNRPDINKFQTVRLVNSKPMKLLNLSPPLVTEVDERVLYSYFMTWPLIASCCVQVKNYSDVFKPEYIVSQLLLQWVRESQQFDGIIYKSNHLDPELYRIDGELHNVVVPVKDISTMDLCSDLCSNFKLTETLSWPLYHLSTGGMNGPYLNSGLNSIDKKLPSINLNNLKKLPYSFSILGKLESLLDAEETNYV